MITNVKYSKENRKKRKNSFKVKSFNVDKFFSDET